MLKVGCRWCDCPADYGPSTTFYNRFNRWSRRGFWLKLLDALVDAGAVEHRDLQHLRQGAASGVRSKGRRTAQAIGRSRGGWTTKVLALRLVRVLPSWHGLTGIVHLAFTTRRGLSPAVRALIDHLAASLPRDVTDKMPRA